MSHREEGTNLYVQDGESCLWYLAYPGGDPVTGSLADLAELAKHTTPLHVKVAALPNNTSLILHLHDMLRGGDFAESLQVCSPLCLAPAIKHDPEEVLWALCHWNPLSPSLGGWHDFTDTDRVSYELAMNPANEDAFARHPLAGPLGFITGGDPRAQAELIGTIRDPRWYVDLRKPSAISKLNSYLGLLPRVQRGVSGDADPVFGSNRCSMVQRAWRGQDGPPTDLTAPGVFFWRAWDHYGRGWKADLRTSQRFVKFLKDLWLQVLYQDRQDLTVPGDLFRDAATASAFQQHCSQLAQPMFVA